jgi:hypothetical protein
MGDELKRARTGPIAAGLAAIAALLVLPGLGATSLWEDEAKTAFVARNVLHTGLPMASDGRNVVSLFTDNRDIRDGLFIWQPWLQIYLAASPGPDACLNHDLTGP